MVKFLGGVLGFLQRKPAVPPQAVAAPPPRIQGYVDEISLTQVHGWVRDLNDPTARIGFNLVVAGRGAVARGVADQFYAPLADESFGDGKFGFAVPVPAGLTATERAGLSIVPDGTDQPLGRGPAYQGYVDQRSTLHVAGWIHNRFDPAERAAYEVVLPSAQGERVIATGTAERFSPVLAQQSVGDGFYGFLTLFPAPLAEAERDALIVRRVGADAPIALSPSLDRSFELVSNVAMDIVNNCNLRCPFCLFDYSDTKTTHFMSDETFEAALQVLPLVRDAGLWLSCLHEPSLHPKFLHFIDRIPRQWRRKIMFTTNLAKRMPDSYFAALADSGVFHVNVSVESLVPEFYEKFRKGARWPIFKENWDRLVAAWRAHPNPPRLRYIMMAYQSNLREIPALVKYLLNERCAAQVEIRYTFERDYIPASFRQSEFLAAEDWTWLARQLAGYSADAVILNAPEPAPAPASAAASAAAEATLEAQPEAPKEPEYPALPLNLQIKWDGRIAIYDHLNRHADQQQIATPNINRLDSLGDFLTSVSKAPIPGIVQGFIDELSTTAAAGWMRDANRKSLRVGFNVAVTNEAGTRIIAQGRASQFCEALADQGWPDPYYGFRVTFPAPITLEERDTLEILPTHSPTPLRRAPKYQGYIDERSTRHIRGWVRNRFAPEERVAYEVVLRAGAKERILAAGSADLFDPELEKHGVGDAFYGFRAVFDPPLTEAERDAVMVRPALGSLALELSPRLIEAFAAV